MDECRNRDVDMRFRFAEQIIRFWKKSKQRDERNSLHASESQGNIGCQDQQSERPVS